MHFAATVVDSTPIPVIAMSVMGDELWRVCNYRPAGSVPETEPLERRQAGIHDDITHRRDVVIPTRTRHEPGERDR